MKRFPLFRSLTLLMLPALLAAGILMALGSGRPAIQVSEPSPFTSAGYLGITYLDLSRPLATDPKLVGTRGALITAVAPGSPAEQFGFLPGDLIVSLDDQPVGETCPLLQSLLARRAGDQVTVVIQRGDQNMTLPVVLSQRVR
jgi:S1-C subfamily serine protease